VFDLVLASITELHVVMSYLDPPLDSSAKYVFFADLDLTVVTPSGTILRGNGVAGADAFATNEKVVVQGAAAGTYKVHVTASKFPIESTSVQFALAVSAGTLKKQAVVSTGYIDKAASKAVCKSGQWKCDESGEFAGVNCAEPVDEWHGKKNLKVTVEPKQVKYLRLTRPQTDEPGIQFIRKNSVHVSRGVTVCIAATPFSKLAEPGLQCVSDVYRDEIFDPLYIDLPKADGDVKYWAGVYCISNTTCEFQILWKSGDRTILGLSIAAFVTLIVGSVLFLCAIVALLKRVGCFPTTRSDGFTRA
jgi:hypothetical protein